MEDKHIVIYRRIKESKLNTKGVIKALGLKRGNFYRRVKHALTKEFIAQIGHVIDWDFTIDFPEMKGFHYYFKERIFQLGDQEEAFQRKQEYIRFDELQSKLEKQDELIASQNKKINGMETRLKHITAQQKITNASLKKLFKILN